MTRGERVARDLSCAEDGIANVIDGVLEKWSEPGQLSAEDVLDHLSILREARTYVLHAKCLVDMTLARKETLEEPAESAMVQ